MARFMIVACVLAMFIAVALSLTSFFAPPAWLAGIWRVEEIRGLPVVHDATITFYPGGGVNGKSACNGFGGRVKFLGERLLSLEISKNLAACLDSQMMLEEDLFLRALGPVERARRDSEGGLILVSKTDEVLLKFTRIGDAPARSTEKAPFHKISGNLE
jgi:heat shock protein HslJ